MAVLVGIDEAGFGPLLGPLVVSSSAFSIPGSLLPSDLWQVLKRSVSNRRKRLIGRLLIADSKKAYTKSLGIKHLERTTLTSLKCLGQTPATLPELFTLLCPECFARLSDYPWYKETEKYCLTVDKADVAIASQVFTDDMAANDIGLLELKSYCLDVAYYNKVVSNVRNKARVLFTAACQLIKNAYDNFGENELHIIIDRQGGRTHYQKILQQMFGEMELKIVKETPANSSYELEAKGKKMHLHFTVGADSRFMPVSLASMVSKYLRELLVQNINNYFSSFHPQLKPTAGYWKDGLRFIEDLKTHVPHVQYERDMLIRSR